MTGECTATPTTVASKVTVVTSVRIRHCLVLILLQVRSVVNRVIRRDGQHPPVTLFRSM